MDTEDAILEGIWIVFYVVGVVCAVVLCPIWIPLWALGTIAKRWG